MGVEGQEDLMSIQYFGQGIDDPTPDRYTPHCDGQCDGLPFKNGGRVATMVMYCDVPEVGGGTNFQNSGVFVKPSVSLLVIHTLSHFWCYADLFLLFFLERSGGVLFILECRHFRYRRWLHLSLGLSRPCRNQTHCCPMDARGS